jgi:RNA polymerase sigma-70 factor (ECF subfamily)
VLLGRTARETSAPFVHRSRLLGSTHVSHAMKQPVPPPQREAVATVPPAEPSLVAALQRGEADAFATLVREHAPQLLATARRMLGNEEDARDALQEGFASAFRGIGGFAGKCRLATWLHRIVVNMALMKLRSRRSRPEASFEELQPRFHDDGHHVEPPCPWSERAIERLQSVESRAILRDAIDQLPAVHREVVVLRDIEQLSTEEVSELLGSTPNAVKIRLHRARQALRTLLDRHLQDLLP